MIRRTLIGLGIATALVACQHATDTTQIQANESSLNRSIEKYTQDFLRLQPALATSLSLPTSTIGEYQDKWPDYSPEGMQGLQRAMGQSIAALNQIDADQLTPSEQLHLNINKVIAHYYQGATNFPAGYIDTWGGHLPYVVNQISGPLIDIPKLLEDQHPLNNTKDVDDFMRRLEGLATLAQQVKQKMLADAEAGIILPQALFPNTLGYLNKFTAPDVQQHALYIRLEQAIKQLSDINSEQQLSYLKRAQELLSSRVYPEFKQVHQALAKLKPRAPKQDGIWAQPGGEAFYQHEIQYLGDSSLTAEQIHQIGLDEVARISQQMDSILKQQGLAKGSVGERMANLVERPEFIYEDSDAGRAKLLADLNTEIQKIMQQAPSLFATLPTQKVVVKRIPVVAQDGAAGGFYTPPSLDGARPGEFSINLKDMKAQPSFGLKTLTYHEAVPGHHFQISLNMAQTDIGIMRQNASFNAYVEGWALYSELVAYEMGMYKDDPWGNLGRLQAEIYRAARLVVDTGLHHKRWTRQQAIDYFHQATGTAMSDVESAIDRYMAWPGQALGYKLGMLKLVELRTQARQALGSKFDIKAFHDLILLPGARPLSIVEQDVSLWIATQS